MREDGRIKIRERGYRSSGKVGKFGCKEQAQSSEIDLTLVSRTKEGSVFLHDLNCVANDRRCVQMEANRGAEDTVGIDDLEELKDRISQSEVACKSNIACDDHFG